MNDEDARKIATDLLTAQDLEIFAKAEHSLRLIERIKVQIQQAYSLGQQHAKAERMNLPLKLTQEPQTERFSVPEQRDRSHPSHIGYGRPIKDNPQG